MHVQLQKPSNYTSIPVTCSTSREPLKTSKNRQNSAVSLAPRHIIQIVVFCNKERINLRGCQIVGFCEVGINLRHYLSYKFFVKVKIESKTIQVVLKLQIVQYKALNMLFQSTKQHKSKLCIRLQIVQYMLLSPSNLYVY